MLNLRQTVFSQNVCISSSTSHHRSKSPGVEGSTFASRARQKEPVGPRLVRSRASSVVTRPPERPKCVHSHVMNILIECVSHSDPERRLCPREDSEDSPHPQPGQHPVAMREGQGGKHLDQSPRPSLKHRPLSRSLSSCIRTRRKLPRRG